MAKFPLISVVDNDDSVGESLRSLNRSVGFRAEVFASAEALLNSDHLRDADCLVLDVRDYQSPCRNDLVVA
jgi:FixJ family two-component response regulator